jgi:CheY-like chemotaxis protein
VAHDFNNLLTVILNCGLFVRDAVDDAELREQVGEIVRAAERGADLTRQLLVFSRQGTAATEVFDVEQVLSDTERLLRRTLGENIELKTAVAPDASQVRLGQGQLEQILINLSVNARDAMPDGGILTIATCAVDIARDDSASFQGLTPGRYVQLTVADTGSGMAPEVVAQAFDPFYTTKPTGEGTGLGLATVYGIVKQAGGDARLYSERGLGTTVKVYLPLASESPLPEDGTQPRVATPAAGGKTVLLVEDESSVRTVTARILAGHGYRVLQASGPLEALAIGSQHLDEVDLLLTDVVMPQMPGVELAERLRHDDPGLPVVFMSGYTGEVVLRQGVDQTETRLLEKPFTSEALVGAVKEALGLPRGATA